MDVPFFETISWHRPMVCNTIPLYLIDIFYFIVREMQGMDAADAWGGGGCYPDANLFICITDDKTWQNLFCYKANKYILIYTYTQNIYLYTE